MELQITILQHKKDNTAEPCFEAHHPTSTPMLVIKTIQEILCIVLSLWEISYNK